jgi:hypothetical protein
MTMKQVIIIFGLLFISSSLSAQIEEPVNPEQSKQKEKTRFIDKLVFGGDIGLSFGTITYIKLEPVVGYKITPRFTAGIGPIYIFEKYKNYNLQSSTYGGKAIASFTILRGTESGGVFPLGNLLLHAENEIVSVEPLYERITQIGTQYYYEYFFGSRKVIDNLLLGFGLTQPIAGRFSVSIFALWDVTQSPYSPYSNPILKFGFNF